MYCDFHTHLHLYSPGDPDLEQIDAASILTVACSVDLPSYRATQTLSSRNIIPTFGIHPFQADQEVSSREWEAALESSPIIGEVGLDFFWARHVKKHRQEWVFETQLDHAHRRGKSVVIHTQGAEKRVLDILKNFPQARPIIHWYHGPEVWFREILNRGYPCTFGLELRYSRYIRHLARLCPEELLLTETDNPDSEVWLGGTRRDPLLIKEVVKALAKARGQEEEEVKALVWKNSSVLLSTSVPVGP